MVMARAEVEAVRLDDVAREGRHRNAAVLDLGVAQEADGLLLALAPEVLGAEPQRVVEADRRVELLGQRLEVRLGLLQPRLGGAAAGPTNAAAAGGTASATASFILVSACVVLRSRACRGARALSLALCVCR